ncbi:hypothetical protein HDV57DRAFT_119298 [Trichoderma longibrachiatum]|uniref:Uncharacterized protein n=1 Tax=Trichoderma longibrachiatum ATCC 18648 TaxID=983965 RepID=A0A2T4BUA0_TRILO|nr:hypothetical protein M440DRAFT_154769 [Trichoderma longibrachiatum ATCC 18648]
MKKLGILDSQIRLPARHSLQYRLAISVLTRSQHHVHHVSPFPCLPSYPSYHPLNKVHLKKPINLSLTLRTNMPTHLNCPNKPQHQSTIPQSTHITHQRKPPSQSQPNPLPNNRTITTSRPSHSSPYHTKPPPPILLPVSPPSQPCAATKQPPPSNDIPITIPERRNVCSIPLPQRPQKRGEKGKKPRYHLMPSNSNRMRCHPAE